jgi:hypothetical protein
VGSFEQSEVSVKNITRFVVVVLPLAGAVGLATSQSSFAMPQSSLEELAMSQSSIQEIIATGREDRLPPLRNFTVEGSTEAPAVHRRSTRQRTRVR